MAAKNLRNGPWSAVFEGKWENHRVEFLVNEDRETLTLIYDESGQVAILNRYFVLEGDQSRLAARLDCYSQVIEKYYPEFKAKYFSISAGPKYYTAEELDHGIEKDTAYLDVESEKLRRCAQDIRAKLVSLKNAGQEFSDRLFSEPVTLVSVTSQEYKTEIKEAVAGAFILGQQISGDDAVEKINDFKATIIEGNIEQQINAMKILAENCVSSDINAVVLDENNYFEKMAFPNKNLHLFDKYVNLQPVGMPVKTPALETIPIDLNMLSGKMFAELINSELDEKSDEQKAIAQLAKVLEKNRGKLESLEDVTDLLLNEKNDTDKFHSYQAARIIKVVEITLGAYIGGRTNFRNLSAGRLNKMGIITRIDLTDLPENLKKLFVLSITKLLNDNTEKGVECVIFIPDSEKYFPQNSVGEIEKHLLAELENTLKSGVAFCLGTEAEISLNSEIANSKSLMIDFIEKNEVAIKSRTKRGYRAKLRPSLSS